MKVFQILIAVVLFSVGAANAKVIEAFNCFPKGKSAPVLVEAKILDDGRGIILAAGQTNYTLYEVKGFDRRWDWTAVGGDVFIYAFIINIHGNGGYYDFSDAEKGETVFPSQNFDCRIVE